VLQLPAELAFVGVDQEAAVQGLDGIAFPARDIERPSEVQIQEACPPAVSKHGLLAERDTAFSLPGESEKKPAVG
jgi:hypothetical protein